MAATIELVSPTFDELVADSTKEIEEVTVNIEHGESFNLKIDETVSYDDGRGAKPAEVKRFTYSMHSGTLSITGISIKVGGRTITLDLSHLGGLKKVAAASGGRRNKKSHRRHRKSKKGTRKGTRRHR